MADLIQDDYTADAATAGRLTVGGQVSGVLEVANDEDWFQISLDAGTTYSFTAKGDLKDISSNNIYIRLMNSNGKEISGKFGIETIGFTAVENNVYYISVKTSLSNIKGNYTLSSRIEKNDDYREDTLTTGKIVIGQETSAKLEVQNDEDWFSVYLEKENTYTFRGTGVLSTDFPSSIDMSIRSADDSSKTLADGHGVLSYSVSKSGTYYVTAKSLISSAIGSYTINGIKDKTDDYSSDTSTKGFLAAGGQVNAEFAISSDVDWFRVDLVAGQTYSFTTSANLTGLHFGFVSLSLLDSTGNAISGATEWKSLGYSATKTGTYFLSATTVASNITGTYTIKSSIMEPDEYSSNMNTTGLLTVGGNASGKINTNGDVDWIKIDLTNGNYYSFEAISTDSNENPASLYLSLRDESGKIIDGISSYSRLTYFSNYSGTYYIEISQSGSVTNSSYKITANKLADDDYSSNQSTTGTIQVDGKTTGLIGVSGDIDWFSIELISGKTYSFAAQADTTGGVSISPALTIYDLNGNQLVTEGINGYSAVNAKYTGKYYVAMKSYTKAATGSYTIFSKTEENDDYSDNANTTGNIDFDHDVTGKLGTYLDEDWFKVDIKQGNTYSFTWDANLIGFPFAGLDLKLQDADGNIASVNPTGRGFYYKSEKTGLYYLKAKGLIENNTGTYRISASVEPLDDYNDNPTTIGHLFVGSQASGRISLGGDSDWFAINLVSGIEYIFKGLDRDSAGGTVSDVRLNLYSSTGGIISGSVNTDDIVYKPSTSGVFYIGIESSSNSDFGTYTISANTTSNATSPTIALLGGKILEGANGNLNLLYNVILSEPAKIPVSFTIKSTGGTATAGSDYAAIDRTVTIAAGSTTATIEVPVVADTKVEADETVILTLSQVNGAQLANNASSITATGTILNDDLPTLTLSADSVKEGASGTTSLSYTVRLSDAATTPITFTAKTTGGTASTGGDYTAIDQRVTIAAGATSATIKVSVIGDTRIESNETVIVTLSDINGAGLTNSATAISATGTILNDDVGASFVLSAYKALNPDLVAAFGSDNAAYVRHYINSGKAEGRTSAGFDAEAYAALNPDLLNAFGLNETALANHYRTNGLAEGRVTTGFDADAYAAMNPDLFAAFGTNHEALIRHYASNGKAEGRVATGFDVDAYAALNPDLFRAFGLNSSSLINHYIQNGKAEGRGADGFDVDAYAALNPDLFAAFGLDQSALINHYINSGRAEGRAAMAPLVALGLPMEPDFIA